jgi:integrase
MATFKKRGEWWIDYYGSDRKRHREPVGPAYTLAKEVLAKRLHEIAEGRHFPERVANAKPFAVLADKYWELHGRFLKWDTKGWMLRRFKVAFGTKRIGDISAGDVQRFYNEAANASSNANANRQLAMLRSIFNRAKAWGDSHGENPCAAVKRGREESHRLRYLSSDEMARLQAAAHPRLYPLLMCALLTGMRRGELLGLGWENVSLDRSMIYLLKTKAGRPREVPICGRLREVLLAHGPKDSGPVFDLPVIMLRRYFDAALKEAGVFGFRFHDLRHTFASYFVMRTNDLPALQKVLGHSSPAMTNRYAHLSNGHLASDMAAFESAIPAQARIPGLDGHHYGHQGLAPVTRSLESVVK